MEIIDAIVSAALLIFGVWGLQAGGAIDLPTSSDFLTAILGQF